MKKVIIIGAGPAGLTAGYELLRRSSDYDVTIVEEAANVGGLCTKIVHNDKVLDAGGHMFISNNSQVKEFWNTILPTQGVPSCDDLFLDRYCKISNGGPDPENTDNVMLSREKITRVYNQGKFYESPFRLTKDNVKSFGVGNSIKSGFSQLGGSMFKKKEKSLEEYYVNRYGYKLYDMFLDAYTEKVMGRNPSKISAAFGEVSDRDVITPNISVDKNDGRDLEKATPPFANRFYYPKKGVYQMWENVADRFIEKGGSIHKNCKVLKIHTENGIVTGITCIADGESFFVACDMLISSMPVKDFINGLDVNAPYNVSEVIHGLSYRGLVSIGVELLDMGIKNDTEEKTVNNIIPDAFLYVNEQDIKLGRIQVFNNFSPYMVGKDNHIWLGLNYYCNEGDYYWSMNDQAWRTLVFNDLKKLGIVRYPEDILDYTKVSFGKAFPGYYDTFDRFEEVRKYLDSFDNLYCIGRNGQHNFISMEQSMLTSFEAVKCILTRNKDKSSVWSASDYVEQTETGKVNSALLSEDVEYRGNAVPLQRYDTLKNDEPREPQKEPISIKRMRRPMMTPIKKAEPVLNENGEVIEGAVVFNDYNLIGAPSFRRAPINVEAPQEEEKPQETVIDNVSSFEETVQNDIPDILTPESIAQAIENKEQEMKAKEEKNDEPVVLRNSVVIAQRPERKIPIEVPEEEIAEEQTVYQDTQSAYNMIEQPVEQSVYQEAEQIADQQNEKPLYQTEDQSLYQSANQTIDQSVYQTDDQSTPKTEEHSERSIVSDYGIINDAANTVSVGSSYNSTSNTGSFASKNDNPYAYIWGQQSQSTNDIHEVVTPEITPVKVYDETTSEIENNEMIIESVSEDTNVNSSYENIEEPDESNSKEKQSNVFELPKTNDQASFDYYMEHMFDDLPAAGEKMSSSYRYSKRSSAPANISIVKNNDSSNVCAQTETAQVMEARANNSKNENDAVIESKKVVSYIKGDNSFEEKVEALGEISSSMNKPNEISFAKVDKFVEKEANIENMKVIQRSGSFDDNQTEIFGKVETFEKKEMLEDTERVVKSHHYVDMDALAENIFKKADQFDENTLLSECENVIPRPVYDNTPKADGEIPVSAVQNKNISEQKKEEDFFTPNEERPKAVTPFSPYSSITTEIDPSIVFKNAKVIKSTKVTKQVVDDKPAEPIRKSWLNNLSELGGKEKVIAKYVNGEQVPMKEAAPKKTRTKKVKPADEGTDIVQPPISVVWESNNEEHVEEALPAPKKRGRKAKVTAENNLKND